MGRQDTGNRAMSLRQSIIGIGVASLLGAVGVSAALRGCGRGGDTKQGVKADTVLLEDTTFRRKVAEQDQTIARMKAESARLASERKVWRDSTRALLQKADTEQQVADTSGTLEPGMSPHDSIVRLAGALDMQKRVTATLRLQVIPTLEQVIATDSLIKLGMQVTIDTLTNQRNEARVRVARVTETLSDLREATKPGVRVLGLRLPSWTDDALEVTGAVVVGYAVGKAVRN